MERKALGFLAVASILAAFAFGVLFSQNAYAQAFDIQPPSFPRQSELWSFWADGQGTWNGYGHTFVVQADSRGRLPVITAIHSNGWRLLSNQGVVEFGGDITVFNGGAVTYNLNVLRHSSGIVLRPGNYVVRNESGASETYRGVLLSGYWANP